MRKRMTRGNNISCCFFILLPFFIMGLTACDQNVVYDYNHSFEAKSWKRKDTLNFDFKIDNIAFSYNFYLKLRYSNQYAFYNLYIKNKMFDSLNNRLADSLYEMVLFDPQRGQPKGRGSSGVYDLILPLYKKKIFDEVGRYNLQMQQYMRKDTLKHIHYVGLHIEKNEQ